MFVKFISRLDVFGDFCDVILFIEIEVDFEDEFVFIVFFCVFERLKDLFDYDKIIEEIKGF